MMPVVSMEQHISNVHNEQSECFYAEYYGFAETSRTHNIPPNFVDDIVNRFLNINDPHITCNVLVLPEICPRIAHSDLNPSTEHGNIVRFRRVCDISNIKLFVPIRVLLKIESTLIKISSVEPIITVLTCAIHDVNSCSQGISYPEYFGFIVSLESLSSSVANCHVFKCNSEVQVAGVMQALKSAFSMIASSSSSLQSSSSSSFLPTLSHHGNSSIDNLGRIDRLNKLCKEIQTKSFSEAHEILERFIEVHHADDHSSILKRVQEAGCETIQETNEIIVSCLLRLAEDKPPLQASQPPTLLSSTDPSIHPSSIQHHNPSIHPSSLSPSPEQAMSSSSLMIGITHGHHHAHGSIHTPGSHSYSEVRKQSHQRRLSLECFSLDSFGSMNKSLNQFPENSPMRTMFASVGNNMGKNQPRKVKPTSDGKILPRSQQVPDKKRNQHHHHHHHQQMFMSGSSWRFGILNKVINSTHYARYLKDLKGTRGARMNYLWRKAIVDTIHLIKLNRGRTEEDEEHGGSEMNHTEKLIHKEEMKADYDEVTPCLVEVTKIWEEMLDNDTQSVDHSIIISAMRAGVPRSRRGDIWIFLMNQNILDSQTSSSSLSQPRSSSPSLTTISAQNGSAYKDLLKMWTQHQHAILIDLGRTFPGHPYFSAQLGSGQISLFNILKAYSLYDAEVGYCQGISFVAGILLLHIPEEKSFEVLKHMMYTLNFRKQFCPDMVHLQIKLYQLSRLLHDLHRDLYDHFDRLEISPTLYAAPWFLTIFASQFPLGFVARVFDLIFLQGCEVVIKVAVVLLGNHKELIKQCDGFESVVEFLKTTLPEMSSIQMERVVNQVFDLDISKHLGAYKIEYHVLREEMLALKSSGTKIKNPITKSNNIPIAPPITQMVAMDSMPPLEVLIKVEELTLVNHKLRQQVEQLQSKLSDLNENNNLNIDGFINAPNLKQGSSLSSSLNPLSLRQMNDLLQYLVAMETMIHKVGCHIPEGLRPELERIISTRPRWLTSPATDHIAVLNHTNNPVNLDLQGNASHPANLSIRHSASSGAPTPHWPISPLSDGGVGCYLDREVEDLIGINMSPPLQRVNSAHMDEMKTLEIQMLGDKGHGVTCYQRPSSNYY